MFRIQCSVFPLSPLVMPQTSLQIFIRTCKTFDMLFILLHRTCVQHAARQRQSMCRCVWEAAGQPHDVSYTHSDQSHQPLVALQCCHHHWIPWQRTWWVSRTLDLGSSMEKQFGPRDGRGVVAERGQASYYRNLGTVKRVPAQEEAYSRRSFVTPGFNGCYFFEAASIYFEDVQLPQSPHGELSVNDLIMRAKSFLEGPFKSCSSSATICHASETSHLRTMFIGCSEAASIVQQTFFCGVSDLKYDFLTAVGA